MNHYQSFKKKLKNKTALFLLSAAVIGLCSAGVLADRANFSGEWKLNEPKSELGQFGGRMAAKKMTIVQMADAMTSDVTASNQQGEEVKRKESLSLDGKESENTLSAAAKKKSTAKWSDDGQTLNVNSVIMLDRNGETMEIKVTEVWKLTDNGQALSLQSTSSSSFGESTAKLVYEKKANSN